MLIFYNDYISKLINMLLLNKMYIYVIFHIYYFDTHFLKHFDKDIRKKNRRKILSDKINLNETSTKPDESRKLVERSAANEERDAHIHTKRYVYVLARKEAGESP